MTEHNRNIQDDDFRVIGKTIKEKANKKRVIIIVTFVLFFFAVVFTLVFWLRSKPHEQIGGLFDDNTSWQSVGSLLPLGHSAQISYTEEIDTIINDIHLSLLIPHNATPALVVGTPSVSDTTIILAMQAADIRADNQKILGSFVYKGDVIAQGKSKKGYCAIIDNNIIIGAAESTSLFEEAADKGGYFFRQYPLVDNGILVESGPKGKSLRRALCRRIGEVFVALSETDESMHDFAQALVDLGVENAIYLVGGQYAYGWFVDKENTLTELGHDTIQYQNENYIVWNKLK